MKIDLTKITECSVKGTIKEHKKTGNKKIDLRRFFLFNPLKNPADFLCATEKKLTRDENSGKNDVTQVTA